MGDGPAAGQVQSVDRALIILETVAAAGDDVGLAELAARVGVHKSTASRLVSTLEAHGLLETTDRGRYHLGLGLVGLASAATMGLDIVRAANPALRALSRETGETANLAVLADRAALYLDQVSGTSTLQANSWVGQRIPLHATSNGKVLLAHSEPSMLERVCAEPLSRFTGRTLVTREELEQELARVRSTGVAVAVDEWEEGLTAVAAPILGFDGHVLASMSVSGPTFRLHDIDALSARVRAAAMGVSRRPTRITG